MLKRIFISFLFISGVNHLSFGQDSDTIYYYNSDRSDSIACARDLSGKIYFQLRYSETTDTNRLENFYKSIIPTIGLGNETFMTKFMAKEDARYYCNCDVKTDSVNSILSWNQHGYTIEIGGVEYWTLISYTIICKANILIIRAHNIRIYDDDLMLGSNKYPRIFDVPKKPIETVFSTTDQGELYDALSIIEKSVSDRLQDYLRYMKSK